MHNRLINQEYLSPSTGHVHSTATDCSRPAISLVTPCYNEEAVLPELYQRCTRVLEQVTGGDYELILVNDGSTDTTWSLICGLAQQNPHVIGVDLSRNFGHQRALTAGLSMARGNAVMVLSLIHI